MDSTLNIIVNPCFFLKTGRRRKWHNFLKLLTRSIVILLAFPLDHRIIIVRRSSLEQPLVVFIVHLSMFNDATVLCWLNPTWWKGDANLTANYGKRCLDTAVHLHTRPLPWRQGNWFRSQIPDYAQQGTPAFPVKIMHFNQNKRQALSEVPSTAQTQLDKKLQTLFKSIWRPHTMFMNTRYSAMF